MKQIIKLILSPIILLISLVQCTATFIIHLTAWLLSTISLITFITSIFVFFNDGVKDGLMVLLFSWFISPFGLPAIAQFLVDKTNSIKNALIKCYS